MNSDPESICFAPQGAATMSARQAPRWLRQLIGAAALWLLAVTPALAAAVGMVTDLTGKVWTVEGAVRQPLAILAYLEPGTVIEVDKGASVSITFYSPAEEQVFSGAARFRIEKQGIARISGAAPAVQRLGALAAEATSREMSQSGRKTQAAVRMRSLAGSASILGMSPDKTAVRPSPPRFSWTALPDIGKYRLTVVAGDGTPFLEETVSAAEWRLPADKPLAPGKDYTWSVEAILADGAKVAGKACFSVIDADVAARLDAESPKGGASFAQRLRHAIALEGAGLNEDARILWRELASERPTEPAVQKRAQP